MLGMINRLPFADGQVIMAGDKDDIYYILRKLRDEYEQRGLPINEKKTEYMMIGGDTEELNVGRKNKY